MSEDKLNNVNEEENKSVETPVTNNQEVKTEQNILDEIEAGRADFHKRFVTKKKVGRIAMATVLVLIISAMVFIVMKNMVLNIIGYVLAGLTIIGMIVYYFLMKRKLPADGNVYIDKESKLINQFVFNDEGFEDVQTIDKTPDNALKVEEVLLEKVYDNISSLVGRNQIKGKYKGHEFTVWELLLRKPSTDSKRRNVENLCFLGKYLIAKNDYNIDDRFVLVLKNKNAEKVVDQPNAIDDLTLLKEDDNLLVYGLNDASLKNIVGTAYISKFKKIAIEEPLLNLVAVIWGGHTSFFISYDDAVTTIPFDKPFQQESQVAYRNHVKTLLSLGDKE